MSDYRNHSENSLRSNSSSCRFACLAYAIQESKMIPIIVHPINSSSCGMFLGLLSFSLISLSSLVHRLPHFALHVLSLTFENILASLRLQALRDYRTSCSMFPHYVRKHSCVPSVASDQGRALRQAKRAELVTAHRASCFLVINHSKTFMDKPSGEPITCVPSVASASRLPHGASCLLTTFENIPHEEVFRGMQIL